MRKLAVPQLLPRYMLRMNITICKKQELIFTMPLTACTTLPL
jgi:hypothetical protein